tara:strand:- start:49 stop:216 length:168 start_codon:yes stop_codon:yes gene_type:complete
MNCWYCKAELEFEKETDIDQDFEPILFAEFSIKTNFSCPKCFSSVQAFKRRDAYD